MTHLNGRTIVPHSDGEAPPLSFAQELLWHVHQTSPETFAWNVASAWRVRGPLDVHALEEALGALIERHESLRTVYLDTEQGPRQRILPPRPMTVSRVNLPAGADIEEAARVAREHVRVPFDLGNDVQLRALLVTLASDDHVLVVISHHIVSDSWSKIVLARELSELYSAARSGREPELAPLPIQFADFATWERGAQHLDELAEGLAYWRTTLGGELPTLALPTDRPRTGTLTFEGADRYAMLPRPLAENLKRLARDRHVTLFMALLTAYAALLHRYTGQDDLVIGSPIAGRTVTETEGLIGFFANTLALRIRIEGDPTFAELLSQVRDVCLDAYEHQDVPSEQLILELQKDRRLSPAPLFQAVLTMQDTLEEDFALDGATVERLDVGIGATKFDLTLRVAERNEGLRLWLSYRGDLLLPETADRILTHFTTLLQSAAASPDEPISSLQFLSEDEQRTLSSDLNATAASLDLTPVHEQFVRAALRHPDEIAVACGSQRRTYAELHAQSDALADRLRAAGVGEGTLAGVYLERSPDAVAALLGILKAGGTFVPLDPELPDLRIAHVLSESGVQIVVTDDRLRGRLPASGITTVSLSTVVESPARAEAERVPVAPEDVAYVVFTSGSTGVPKGVEITHRNLSTYTAAICTRLGVTAESRLRFGMVSSLAVDLGYTALFPALCTGGTLCLIPKDVAADAARFAESMSSQAVDVLKITPSHFAALLDGAGADVLPRRWLVLGGEASSWELVNRVRSLGEVRVMNHYGPTETTVGASTYVVEPASSQDASLTVPIGLPLPNVRTYVLDAKRRLVPLGVAGELYIGGAGVARGYLHRPDLTAERFLSDPFVPGNGRMYRTGDRVRRIAPGGEIEFLGRIDNQVKIRGFRVELGEIESVLATHPRVSQAAVIFKTAETDAPRLVAYLTRAAGSAADRDATTAIRAWLEERLPAYMLPDEIAVLDALPLGPSGKVDRSALAALETRNVGEDTYVAPRTPTEEQIAAVWAEMLKVERVSVEDNFLALGFHSILAIRALNRLSRIFGVRVPLRSFFESPTIAHLAVTVDREVQRAAARELERALEAVGGMSDAQAERLTAGRPKDGATER